MLSGVPGVLWTAQFSLVTTLLPFKLLPRVARRLRGRLLLAFWCGLEFGLRFSVQGPRNPPFLRECTAAQFQLPLDLKGLCWRESPALSLSQYSTVFLGTWSAAAALPTLEKRTTVCIRPGTCQGKALISVSASGLLKRQQLPPSLSRAHLNMFFSDHQDSQFSTVIILPLVLWLEVKVSDEGAALRMKRRSMLGPESGWLTRRGGESHRN